MPHMAISALSENWLMKELGDLHWDLLSKGLQQKTSEIKDHFGNRLYATFVRTNILVSPLDQFSENDILSLEGTIKRFKTNTYITNTVGRSNGNQVKATFVSCFTHRDENDNSKISKSDPKDSFNQVEELEEIPEFLQKYRLLKKGLLGKLEFGDVEFSLSDEVIYETQYQINPFYDINGGGLLYFASYPIISDKCMTDYVRALDSDSSYQTIYRDVFYLANCNKSDEVCFQLNSLEYLDNSRLVITTSLYRKSDKTKMATIFTIKQRSE